jgi:glycerol-3-phosphate dehydrogenase (NAD(P)+)
LNAIASIGVAGAGAWGVALANAAAAAGRRVTLWGRGAEAMDSLAQSRQSAHLPGVALARGIEVSADIAALAQCEAALVVVPAQATRRVVAALAGVIAPGAPLVACA